MVPTRETVEERMKTTLIAATLNEIEAVQVVLPPIDKTWVDDIIITDGGSTDGTVEYCQKRATP
jgi:glycosyltransferase involved in cell wall biosynthesis